MQLTQENLKKIDLVTVNNSLKEQNLQLEKENIKTLELLKMTKLKVDSSYFFFFKYIMI